MDTINYDEFKRLDIRIGRVSSAERVEGTDKLMKLELELGDEKRVLVAGIADVYRCEDVQGKYIPVLLNLEPRKIRGIESRGMILAADENGVPVLLHTDKAVSPGSIIR